jgi:diamine N-acetyltransferase
MITETPQAPVGRAAAVTLRPVTGDNLRDVLRLKVTPDQEKFVAPNPVSLAQAHFTKEAWYRAIFADEVPVGFMMLYDNPVKPEYFLWRLMVDARYQGNGFAWRAVEQLVDYVRTRPGAKELLVSHGQGEGSPAPFYARFGFQYTGEEDDGELIMRLPLPPADAGRVAQRSEIPKPLTHVVLFKLKDRSPEVVIATAEVLRSMEGKIDPLQEIEVGVNVIPSARAYDIALLTRFASLTDMHLYQDHPIHQGVLAHMREVMEASVAVDFEGS